MLLHSNELNRTVSMLCGSAHIRQVYFCLFFLLLCRLSSSLEKKKEKHKEKAFKRIISKRVNRLKLTKIIYPKRKHSNVMICYFGCVNNSVHPKTNALRFKRARAFCVGYNVKINIFTSNILCFCAMRFSMKTLSSSYCCCWMLMIQAYA